MRIVTDTTACLPAGFAEAHGVVALSQIIVFGGESLAEGREIDAEGFLQRLVTSPVLPKTSAPSPGEFARVYRDLLGESSTLLSIHPSADISGTVRSACAALQGDLVQADVHILDTRTVAANLGTMVQLAVAWAEAGRGAEGILADLHAMIPRSRSFFAVRTLEYLQRGGRIGKAAALAANALSIKPILELRDGIVQPLERVRTYARALDRLAELVLAQCPPGAESHLAVMHCGAAAEAAALASRLHSIDGQGDIPVYQVGAAIAAHAGPGVVGAAFFAPA